MAGDTGRALRRARINLTTSDLGPGSSRSTTTDQSGRYEIRDLPAARYRVAVTRSGYLPLDYGQRRPGEQGRPVQLADAQVLERVDFALPRMSVITGHVTDEAGEPMEGVTVLAMRSLFLTGNDGYRSWYSGSKMRNETSRRSAWRTAQFGMAGSTAPEVGRLARDLFAAAVF